MGSRKSSFKTGGGGVDQQDGTIVDYEFTDAFMGTPYVAGTMKELKTGRTVEKPHSLNCCLQIRLDGADDNVLQTLRVAKQYDSWEITDDGHTITPLDGQGLGSSSAFGKFIQSWEAASGIGAESDAVPEGVFNYAPIVGSRVKFIMQDYSEAELASIKKLGATEKRVGKDGKEYNRQSLMVETVYSTVTAKPAKLTGKPTSSLAKTGKTNGAAKEVNVDDLATVTLLSILQEAKDQQMAKVRLSVPVLRKLLGNPQMEAVRTRILDDEFLETENGWTFDAASKDKMIALEQ